MIFVLTSHFQYGGHDVISSLKSAATWWLNMKHMLRAYAAAYASF